MKHITAKLLLYMFMALVVLMQPVLVMACGISVIPAGSNNRSWDYGNDSAEVSFINYQKGTEKLIISRDFTNATENAVWVVPLPAKPELVKTDILNNTPTLNGYNIVNEAHDKLSGIKTGVLASQIYPAVPKVLDFFYGNKNVNYNTGISGASSGLQTGPPPGNSAPKEPSVRVYDSLEKNGMTAEVLSTNSSDALYDYLKAKGLNIEKDSITSLKDYIGSNYTFVANWISNNNSYDAKRGLEMTFPTDKIFYPLKPSSAYPGEGLPESIYVMGYVSPKLYKNIEKGTSVKYFQSSEPYQGDSFKEASDSYKYTKIVINSPPRQMTEDLYISPRAPIKALSADLIASKSIVAGFALYIPLTMAAVLLSALALLAFEKRKIQKALLTKPVALSLLGVVGTYFGSKSLYQQQRKRIIFTATYSIVFVIITILLFLLLANIFDPGLRIMPSTDF